MFDDLLKAVLETTEEYLDKLKRNADPSIVREFLKKVFLGVFLILPTLCGVVLFAQLPSLTNAGIMGVAIFLNLPWVVFWIDVHKKYMRFSRGLPSEK